MSSNQLSQLSSPGQRFRAALQQEQPLQIPGVINAYTALQATELGFKALYLSGAGVANASYGLPDLGMTQLPDVLTDVNRITSVTDLPLLVDIDTGWGHAFTIARTIKQMIKAGVAAVHMEDQINAKRCGHRPGKVLVAADEMCDRIKAAVDARTDEQFVIMARTDAAAVEGIDAAIERAKQYVAAGADMIFAEALTEAEHFKHFTSDVPVPVLANMTEFGKSPLLTTSQLAELGIAMALYPLSAFRAMSQAALQTLSAIRQQGSQQSVIDKMQTRDELYATLQYKKFEKKLDRIFSEE